MERENLNDNNLKQKISNQDFILGIELLISAYPILIIIPSFFLIYWLSNKWVFATVFATIGLLFSLLVRREIIKAQMPLWQKTLSLIVALVIYLFFSYIVIQLYLTTNTSI